MDWLRRAFRRTDSARRSLICYLRENGPIAYALDLFDADPRSRVDAMLESGLAWYWRSGLGTADPTAPREWTQLTRWSMAALLEELRASSSSRQPGRDSRAPTGETGDSEVTIVGIDAEDAPTDLSDDRVAPWVRRFASDAPGPLHIVVRRDPDLVFVAQQPPDAVRELLYAWGIDRAKAERRAYARLQARDLEHWLKSLAS
jgi:hypothetical protein